MQTGRAYEGSRQARRKNNTKSTINKTIKRIFYFVIVLFTIIFGAGGGAIVVMRAGLTPDIQEYLVTTAMTTLSHKYIANIVASPAKIKEIMANNRIDENYDVQNSALIKQNEAVDTTDSIELIDISKDGYKGYLLKISNPKKVFLGVSSQLGTRGEKISSLVQRYAAIGGINAGGFVDTSGKGMGAKATGIIIKDGKILFRDQNIVKYSIIGFNTNDVLVLGKYTLDELPALKLRDAVDFHPFLIINGKPTTVHGNGGWGSGPRTAIGQKSDGTVLLAVVDGRQLKSKGATMKQMQDIMLENGAVNAANLDGGSSTVMYYKTEIVNSPCSPYGDRFLPTAFLIKK